MLQNLAIVRFFRNHHFALKTGIMVFSIAFSVLNIFVFSEKQELRLSLKHQMVANPYSAFSLKQIGGDGWRRRCQSSSTGTLSKDGKSLIFPNVNFTGDFILEIRHPEDELQITSLEYGKYHWAINEFQMASASEATCVQDDTGWMLKKDTSRASVEIIGQLKPGQRNLRWNQSLIAAISAVFCAYLILAICRKRILSPQKKIWEILCRLLFQTRYALFAASCLTGVAALLWLLYGHSPTKISVEFSDSKPPATLLFKTAADTWFCKKDGVWGKSYSFDPQTQNGICQSATSFPIKWFWLIPKNGYVCIKSVTIGDTVISAEDLYWMALERSASNRLTKRGLELGQFLAFECGEIAWNSQVKKHLIQVAIALGAIWAVTFAIFSVIIQAITKWNKWKMTDIHFSKVLGIFFIFATIILLSYLYFSRFLQCETHIFDNDSGCNIGVVIRWLTTGSYRMDPFITTGPALLVPIAGLLWAAGSLEWSAIGAAVLTVNFLYIMLPIGVVWIWGNYPWEKKSIWSFAYSAVLLLGTSLYGFDFISSPMGELPSSCVFIAGALMMFYCHSRTTLVMAGILLGASSEIKSVMNLFLLSGGAIWLWLFCVAEDEQKRADVLKSIFGTAIGVGIFKALGTLFRITVLGNIMAYQEYQLDSSKQNWESGLNMNFWSADFIRETVIKNFDILTRQIGQPCLVIILIMTLLSIYILLSKKSSEYNIVPASLICTAFSYNIFWLLTQSHHWNMRNFEPGWMVFTLSSTLFLLDAEKYISKRTWVATLLPLLFIFGVFDFQRRLTVRPANEIALYVKLNKVFHQEKENGAYLFININGTHNFYEMDRGNKLQMPFYNSIASLFKTIPEKYSSVVWCRSKKAKLPPGYRNAFGTTLYDDGEYVISRQGRPRPQ